MRILSKEKDNVDFKIVGYKAEKTYTFTIKGVRRKGKKIQYAQGQSPNPQEEKENGLRSLFAEPDLYGIVPPKK